MAGEARETRKDQNCVLCGVRLYTGNASPLPKRLNGWVPYCRKCMEKRYKTVSAAVGYKLGLFVSCVMFNLPYCPEYLEEGTAARKKNHDLGVFDCYLNSLTMHGMDYSNGRHMEFTDGVTDIRKAFGGEMATLEVDDEMLSDEDYKQGHIGQVSDWGYGPPDRPYTQEDYDALDKHYDALTSDRVQVSKQAEIAIRKICVLQLEQQYAIFRGDYGEAKKIEDIIKAEMEGEQLRKKDELPQDRARLDDIVGACERAGLLGKTYDELVEILATKAFHSPYGYTRDAADQMLLFIVNATRQNEDLAELDRLPDEYAIQDPLEEFARDQDKREKKIYDQLGIAPLHMKGGKTNA